MLLEPWLQMTLRSSPAEWHLASASILAMVHRRVKTPPDGLPVCGRLSDRELAGLSQFRTGYHVPHEPS